jgi:hypothetical protein
MKKGKSNSNRLDISESDKKKILLSQGNSRCGMFFSEIKCETFLYKDGTYLGEIAHIIDASPKKNLRSPNPENLAKLKKYIQDTEKTSGKELNEEDLIKHKLNGIAVCANCHKIIDSSASYTVEYLLDIKDTVIKDIREEQDHKKNIFKNYNEMSEVVIPLLKENKEIFDLYSAENDPSTHDDKYPLWVKNQNILLKNNRLLKIIFQKNIQLFTDYIQENVITKFYNHVKEFEDTRDKPTKRYSLFPPSLSKLFQVDHFTIDDKFLYQDCDHIINYFNKKKYKDILLITKPIPKLQYKDTNGELGFLDLNNLYLSQLFLNEKIKIQENTTTRIELKNLLYHLKILEYNDINYEFDFLNMILIFKKNIVKLVEEYCFTDNNYYEIKNKNDFKIIYNLYVWNDTPTTCKNMEGKHEYWSQKKFISKIYN